MSRTYYNVIRVGVCQGNNTPYYKARRRMYRNKLKQSLNRALHNALSYEEIDEKMCDPRIIKKDSWDEPTDGTMLIDAAEIKRAKEWSEIDSTYANWYAFLNRTHARYIKKCRVNKLHK